MDEFEVEIVGGDTPSSEPSEKPEATPSETPTEAPSEQPAETPVEEAPKEEGLYELPDGRKVDAETVLNEYKNLQKDYTRKSQELASIKPKEDTITNQPKWKDPEWIPENYPEIIEAAKEAIKREQEELTQQEIEQERILADRVDAELTEVKQLDPNVNENRLFEHAAKYKIPNLVAAYQNMKDFDEKLAAIREQTAKDVQKKVNDPVAGGTKQVSVDDSADIYDPSVRTRSLVEHLRSLKK